MITSYVLGLGGTVDYEIRWDSRVVESLVLEYAIRAAEVSTSVPIRSERCPVCDAPLSALLPDP